MMPRLPVVRAVMRSALFTALSQFLLIVSLLLMLSACSNAASIAPTPVLQANLAQPCPQIAPKPSRLVDPERLVWEEQIISQYGDCASRHRLTVEAWPAAK
jgi:hypothetical protein